MGEKGTVNDCIETIFYTGEWEEVQETCLAPKGKREGRGWGRFSQTYKGDVELRDGCGSPPRSEDHESRGKLGSAEDFNEPFVRRKWESDMDGLRARNRD